MFSSVSTILLIYHFFLKALQKKTNKKRCVLCTEKWNDELFPSFKHISFIFRFYENAVKSLAFYTLENEAINAFLFFKVINIQFFLKARVKSDAFYILKKSINAFPLLNLSNLYFVFLENAVKSNAFYTVKINSLIICCNGPCILYIESRTINPFIF